MKKWTLETTEEVGRYRILDVLRHDVVDGEGRPRGDVYTLACPDWCNVVALTEDDELVLVWQHRFGSDRVALEIPGGVVEPGEEPLDAARRELAEETGYEAAALELLAVVEPNPAIQGNRCFTYLARGARRAKATSFDDLEECEVALVPAAHAADLIDGGHVTHALVVVALERFLRVSRGGRGAR